MNPRCLLFPLLLLLSLPAAAQLPSNEASVSLGRWDSSQLGDSPVFGASLNHYWSRARMLSTRVGVFGVHDGDVSVVAGQVGMGIHFFRSSRVSPWVGAGVAQAYTHLSESNDHFKGSEAVLTGIYSGGVDVAATPRFAVGAEFSYMNYGLEIGSRYGYSVDPMIMTVTGRWRF